MKTILNHLLSHVTALYFAQNKLCSLNIFNKKPWIASAKSTRIKLADKCLKMKVDDGQQGVPKPKVLNQSLNYTDNLYRPLIGH